MFWKVILVVRPGGPPPAYFEVNKWHFICTRAPFCKNMSPHPSESAFLHMSVDLCGFVRNLQDVWAFGMRRLVLESDFGGLPWGPSARAVTAKHAFSPRPERCFQTTRHHTEARTHFHIGSLCGPSARALAPNMHFHLDQNICFQHKSPH